MIHLPSCYHENEIPFIRCFQEQYLRPLMPPYSLPKTLPQVIPPDDIRHCPSLSLGQHQVYWRRHVRGDLVWYDFMRFQNKTDTYYDVSKEWYLPKTDVDPITITWLRIHRLKSTLLDNGSPVLTEYGGTTITIQKCPICGIQEFNHKCPITCYECQSRTNIAPCFYCKTNYVCDTHNQGVEEHAVCHECFQKPIQCPACHEPLSTQDKQGGLYKHKSCPIKHLKPRALNNKKVFEFKQSPFNLFWRHTNQSSSNFANIFSHVFTHVTYSFPEDRSQILNHQYACEFLISWRTAALSLYRRNNITLKCKTRKNVIDVFRKYTQNEDDVANFLFGDNQYACDPQINLFQILTEEYELDAANANYLLTTMFDMLLYFMKHPAPTPPDDDRKAASANIQIDNYDAIKQFTTCLGNLIQKDNVAEVAAQPVVAVIPARADVRDKAKELHERNTHTLNELLKTPIYEVVQRREQDPSQLEMMSTNNDANHFPSMKLSSAIEFRSAFNRLSKREYLRKQLNPQRQLDIRGELTRQQANQVFATIRKFFDYSPQVMQYNLLTQQATTLDGQILYVNLTELPPNPNLLSTFFNYALQKYPLEEPYDALRSALQHTSANWASIPFFVTLVDDLEQQPFTDQWKRRINERITMISNLPPFDSLPRDILPASLPTSPSISPPQPPEPPSLS